MGAQNIGGIPIVIPGFVEALMPKDVYVFWDDFDYLDIHATLDTAGIKWVETVLGAGSAITIIDGTDTIADEGHGLLQLTTGATVTDGEQIQGNCETFNIIAGMPLYFECRFGIGDKSDTNCFFGLAITDTTLYATNDCIGFRNSEGVASFLTEQGGTELLTTLPNFEEKAVGTLGGMNRVAFFYDGGNKITAYQDTVDNGVLKPVATRTVDVAAHYVPDTVTLTPSIAVICGDTVGAEVTIVDYILVMQGRYRHQSIS